MEHKGLLDKLADLRSVAAELDRTSDTLLDELRAIERALAELVDFPVMTSYTVEVTYLGEAPEEAEGGSKVWRDWVEHRFAFGKFNGAWRILLTRYRVVEPAPGDRTLDNEIFEGVEPLLDASPELVKAAAGQMRHLLGRVECAAKRRLAEHQPR